MLRGHYPARIDSKGRLKVPTSFRKYIEEQYGSDIFLTSPTGESVRVYPLGEWERIEQKLADLPSMHPARRKFVARTNYYGHHTSIDAQGRILIHPLLRRTAGIVADVSLLGNLTYVEVWDVEEFQKRLNADPYTAEDEAAIAGLGI